MVYLSSTSIEEDLRENAFFKEAIENFCFHVDFHSLNIYISSDCLLSFMA